MLLITIEIQINENLTTLNTIRCNDMRVRNILDLNDNIINNVIDLLDNENNIIGVIPLNNNVRLEIENI